MTITNRSVVRHLEPDGWLWNGQVYELTPHSKEIPHICLACHRIVRIVFCDNQTAFFSARYKLEDLKSSQTYGSKSNTPSDDSEVSDGNSM